MNIKRTIQKSILLILLLLFLYTLSMLLVTLIPNKLVEDNAKISLNIIDNEGTYPKFFFNTPASRLDNYTDRLMIDSTMTDSSKSVIENAMTIKNRTQYWQGYLIFLKPLLIFFNLYQIRYILYILFFVLFVITNLLIYKNTNVATTIAYSFSILTSNVLFISVSPQFIGVYYIMFLSIIVYFKFHNYFANNRSNLFLLLLVIGSVTCFIDFLTAPLITLGIPLAIFLIYNIEQQNANSKKTLIDMGLYSISWAIGYAITFIGKWIIACILLQENVFVSSLNRGLVRVNSEESITLNYTEMIKLNLTSILGFNNFTIKSVLVTLILLIIISILLGYFFHKQTKNQRLSMLLMASYPYLWYIVLANHSQIHFWFTYRIQLIAVFVIIYVILSNFNFDKLLRVDK